MENLNQFAQQTIATFLPIKRRNGSRSVISMVPGAVLVANRFTELPQGKDRWVYSVERELGVREDGRRVLLVNLVRHDMAPVPSEVAVDKLSNRFKVVGPQARRLAKESPKHASGRFYRDGRVVAAA